jgi:AhpD family alkylhydroperoxidase
MVAGITNALNVVADGLGSAEVAALGFPRAPAAVPAEAEAVYAEIRTFYARADVPLAFRLLAADPAYLAEVWAATRRAFTDRRLTRRLKEALAFAVSLTTRSAFGVPFHLGELRRLGVDERGIAEVAGVTQMFSSYTKIADTLQLEPDMQDLVPPDPTPAPGGPGG